MTTCIKTIARLFARAGTHIWKPLLVALLGLHSHAAMAQVNLTPLPPFLAETRGSPMVMLNLSKDHQLFFKAYNEYTDFDGDGELETQYKHSYRYYGYFDNRRCYTYSTTNNRFVPARKENAANVADPTLCGGTGEWHGNFLNWATMTRMDVVRRILYGGKRSTDDPSTATPPVTVLERAHLPTDAHSFAKYYDQRVTGAVAINKITPFSSVDEITICNRSPKNDQYSHNSNIGVPQMLVAKGNFSLWNANERWQCYWRNEKDATNGNISASSGLNASDRSPRNTAGEQALGTGSAAGTYTVRVEVCKTGLDSAPTGTTGFTDDEEARCKFYPLGNFKPAGLLQKYGERNEAAFGLMTGSFTKNTSGGVLRKNVSTFTNEVDLDDGQFKSVSGIVKTLNDLRIYGYNYNSGTYIEADNCNFQLTSLSDGNCVSWGNPMGEAYLEALRYMAGKSANSTFTYTSSGSKDEALGLEIVAWTDPFADSTVADFGDKLCRRTSIINFNASVTSYDNNQWSTQGDIQGPSPSVAMNAETLTNDIGTAEGLYASGKLWAVGVTGTTSPLNNEYCNAKSMTALASSSGICPEAPTYQGGFRMAGAAQYAHTNPIRSDITIPANNKRAFRVDTYGVALATGVPRINVPVPGQAGKFVIIQPAFRLITGSGQGGGTLVDFRVVTSTPTYGKFVVQWEDSEQGGDFDQDVWGTLEYTVTGSNIAISTQTIAESTGQPQGFGYIITGTNGKDGAHFHSGIENFNYDDPTNITVTPTTNIKPSSTISGVVNGGGCNNCNVSNDKTTATYAMLGTGSEVLKDPLWYAAKYGGFDRDVQTTYTSGSALPAAAWDAKKVDGSVGSDGIPDTFFYAIDPAQLERSLEQVFSTILKAGGAAPAAATSSRTSAGGYVYVSTESVKAAAGSNDADNSGEFLRFSFDADGNVKAAADWDAGEKLTTQVLSGGWDTNRRIFTMHETTGPTTFRWASLSANQKKAFTQKTTAPASYDSDTVGENRLKWMRGDSTNELTTSDGLRKRTKTKLGAIVNSTPWYIGPPAAGYTNTDYGGGYGAFRLANAARKAVAVAANDGMVHVFDAGTTLSDGSVTGGTEHFAYVPGAMYTTSTVAPYSKFAALTAKDYLLTSGVNRVNVDGSVMAADMNFGNSTTPNWRTYLFGAFGRGAKGIYALDVTSPQSVTTENAATASSVVKWEFTGADDADMGFITGRTNARNNSQPWQTGYMANGKWAAIYGNGYNSTNQDAVLFIVFASGPGSTGWTSGTHYVKLATGSLGAGTDASPNGLAAPTAVDKDNDGKIDYIYAGDLKGNVWRFDVSAADPASWTSGGTPVFTATTLLPSPSTTRVKQPITTAVVPFAHPSGGYQLVFGTGKALEAGDYPMTTVHSQTLYGIHDKPGSSYPITTEKNDLVQQTSITQNNIRFFSKNPVSYTTSKGWYLDFPVSSEGVIFNPFAEDSQRVNVRSLAPESTTDGCRYDANSFDASLNPITGTPIGNAIPNVNDITPSGGTTVYGAVGRVGKNNFEFSRGGIYKAPTPPPSQDACPTGTAGTSVCVCNPAATTECVYCPDPLTCNPPWKPLPQNQCMYRTISALGSGGVTTDERYGTCSDGRLTWREILRNR